MKRLAALGVVVALLAAAGPARAQGSGAHWMADSDDVASVDAIISALYESISGPAGERDWDRFLSLFLPGAILMNAGPRPAAVPPPRPDSPEGYQETAAPFFRKNPFFETEIARTTHRYGTVAQIWSTYESRREAGGEPFTRGINSIVAVEHQGRWYIASIIWDSERPGNPIPEAYLPGG